MTIPTFDDIWPHTKKQIIVSINESEQAYLYAKEITRFGTTVSHNILSFCGCYLMIYIAVKK